MVRGGAAVVQDVVGEGKPLRSKRLQKHHVLQPWFRTWQNVGLNPGAQYDCRCRVEPQRWLERPTGDQGAEGPTAHGGVNEHPWSEPWALSGWLCPKFFIVSSDYRHL